MQPLARDRYLRMESAPTLGVGVDPKRVLALFWDSGLRDTLLCSHGETITCLLAQLAANGLVTDAPLEAAKGSTWLLYRANGRVHARYLPPLALHAGLAARLGTGRLHGTLRPAKVALAT